MADVGIHTHLHCQVCGEKFDSIKEKGIHVSTEHDLGRGGADKVRPFRSCTCCNDFVYIGMTCTNGTLAVAES